MARLTAALNPKAVTIFALAHVEGEEPLSIDYIALVLGCEVKDLVWGTVSAFGEGDFVQDEGEDSRLNRIDIAKCGVADPDALECYGHASPVFSYNEARHQLRMFCLPVTEDNVNALRKRFRAYIQGGES